MDAQTDTFMQPHHVILLLLNVMKVHHYTT